MHPKSRTALGLSLDADVRADLRYAVARDLADLVEIVDRLEAVVRVARLQDALGGAPPDPGQQLKLLEVGRVEVDRRRVGPHGDLRTRLADPRFGGRPFRRRRPLFVEPLPFLAEPPFLGRQARPLGFALRLLGPAATLFLDADA